MDASGLALATATSTWFHLFLLWPVLRRRLGTSAQARELRGRLLRLLFCSGVAVGLARLIWAFLGSACSATVGLLSCIGIAALAYAGLCQLLHVPEWQAALSRLRQVAVPKSPSEGRRN
jgi:peptidoglycan biosynthesis protein MviN/MurJ (putative lipid II flippase)